MGMKRDGRLEEVRRAMDWLTVWRAHPEQERMQALEAWLAWLREERGSAEQAVREGLARALRFRPQTLERMPLGRLAALLDRRAGEVMDPRLWQLLLVRHYLSAHGDLLVAFLDALGVPHDGRGALEGPPDLAAVGEARLADAVVWVRDGFGRERADRYFRVLLLQDPEAWGPLARFLDARLEAGDGEGPPAGGAADERRVALDEFTTLDRVVIDAVVATAVGAEGALSREEARDLVETVAALNAGRKRSWFHVGFLEGLLEPPGRMPEGGGLDGERKAWALAGLMAAAARRDDREALERLLDGHRELFREAAERPGGPGAALVNVALEALFEAGRFEEGCRLPRGQAGEARLGLGELAYRWATRLWREKEVGEARLLLETLLEVLDRFRGEEAWRWDLVLRVGRRLAQCLQALGELDEARARFEALLEQEARAGRRRAELLADLGLVAAGFRDLAEVRLPEEEGERQALRAALERGRERFEQAVAEAGAEAANAAYALAVLAYLRWWEEDREAPAREARKAVALAIQAMGGSPSAEEYRRLGLLGQV